MNKSLRELIGFHGISTIIASLTLLESERYKLFFIHIYVSMSSHSGKEQEEFYKEFTEILNKTKCHLEYIIEDFNAKIALKILNKSDITWRTKLIRMEKPRHRYKE